jgi:hypothetical protein
MMEEKEHFALTYYFSERCAVEGWRGSKGRSIGPANTRSLTNLP